MVMFLHTTQQLDLLVVDGNRMQYPTLVLAAKETGLEIAHAFDGHHALQVVATQPARLWIANMTLPDMTGIELLRLIKAKRPATPFYLVSDHYSAEEELAARAAGATGYLSKPVNLAWLELCRAALSRQPTINLHPPNSRIPV
jgi:DNA-binding response OmpR family regulator